jgi:hypothetical protein
MSDILPCVINDTLNKFSNCTDEISEQADNILSAEELYQDDLLKWTNQILSSVKEISKHVDTLDEELCDFEDSFVEVPALNGYGLLLYKVDSLAMETIMEEITRIMRITSPAQFIELLKLLR